MIPKVIHYCWFGRNPLPPLALKCIESWRKYCPDYEIKEWNEDNFDVNCISYTAEAYKARKYAFVSDYARFAILYKYGGVYFDTDVEVIKNLDKFIGAGPFMGCEKAASPKSAPAKLCVAPGLGLGAPKGLDFYREIMDFYNDRHFILPDRTFNLETVVTITTKLLCSKGLRNTDEVQQVDGILIYPKEYLCPKDYNTKRITFTVNTLAIHHYDGSWDTPKRQYENHLREQFRFLPYIVNCYLSATIAVLKYEGIFGWIKRKAKEDKENCLFSVKK